MSSRVVSALTVSDMPSGANTWRCMYVANGIFATTSTSRAAIR